MLANNNHYFQVVIRQQHYEYCYFGVSFGATIFKSIFAIKYSKSAISEQEKIFSFSLLLILFNSQSGSIPCLSLPSTNFSRAYYMGRYVLYNLNLHCFEERQGIYTIHAYSWLSHGLWWIWVKVLATTTSCHFFSSVTEWVTDWNLVSGGLWTANLVLGKWE